VGNTLVIESHSGNSNAYITQIGIYRKLDITLSQHRILTPYSVVVHLPLPATIINADGKTYKLKLVPVKKK